MPRRFSDEGEQEGGRREAFVPMPAAAARRPIIICLRVVDALRRLLVKR